MPYSVSLVYLEDSTTKRFRYQRRRHSTMPNRRHVVVCRRQSKETLKLTLPVLTFSGKSEMVVTLPLLRRSKGISFQTWVVGRQWPKLPCQAVECFLQKSLALVTLPALKTEITAFGFFLANFSMETKSKTINYLFRLLVNVIWTLLICTTTPHISPKKITLYTETNLKSTKQLQNYSASALYPHSWNNHSKPIWRLAIGNFSQKNARNMLFPCSNFKFIYTKYNYQGNCMLWRKT